MPCWRPVTPLPAAPTISSLSFGDTPLISAATFERLRAPLKKGAALAVLGFRAADPTGYGRLVVEGDRLVAIREQADASPAERAITLCNAGVMAFDGRKALSIIDKIENANSKCEYYLSDAVAVVRDLGLEAVVIETSEDEVRGINTKTQLAEAEQVMQARLRKAALDAGRHPHRTGNGLPRRRYDLRQGRDDRAVRGDRSGCLDMLTAR